MAILHTQRDGHWNFAAMRGSPVIGGIGWNACDCAVALS